MKKLIAFAIVFAMGLTQMFAQGFGVSGDVQYATKNVSIGTGLMFSEDPAVILHLNPSFHYESFSVTAFYSGHTGLQRLSDGDHYHIVDLLASYQFGDFTIYGGTEFTYKDADTDKTGSGVVGMLTFGKEKVSSTFIFYTDIKFQVYYYILSGSYSLTENLSVYGLIGYTTAEPTPLYGMAGLKYTKGQFYAGTYYVFRDQVPGPTFNVGFVF